MKRTLLAVSILLMFHIHCFARELPNGPSGMPAREEVAFSSFEELHQYLLNKTVKNGFSGSVLVAKNGKPVFLKAYGLASKTSNIRNKVDTKFNLGSLSKLFTTVAIAQLMEKGKLSIDDPIGKYIDIFPKEIAGKVTIRHLLDMSSGWGDYWRNEYYVDHKDHLRTVSDYMAFIKDIPLDFEPGTKFRHCNIGYEVAGAVIEAISGMDYYGYVRKNIFEPSGMAATDSFYRDDPVENLAVGYTNMGPDGPVGKGYKHDNSAILPPRGTPAGGGYSTIVDLLKFEIALSANKLLTPDYTNFLLNRFQGSPGDPGSLPQKIYQTRGMAPGVSTYLGMDPRFNYTIIVLSNYDTPVTMGVADGVIKMFGIE